VRGQVVIRLLLVLGMGRSVRPSGPPARESPRLRATRCVHDALVFGGVHDLVRTIYRCVPKEARLSVEWVNQIFKVSYARVTLFGQFFVGLDEGFIRKWNFFLLTFCRAPSGTMACRMPLCVF